jgi:hypothetical protein
VAELRYYRRHMGALAGDLAGSPAAEKTAPPAEPIDRGSETEQVPATDSSRAP